MILDLTGHDRLYDLQSIAGAFFPGESFREGEPHIESILAGDACLTRITGEAGRAEAKEALTGRDKDALRRAVKRSFYKAASAYTGFSPEWGTFTGIRPAKEYLKYEDERAFLGEFGMKEEKARLCKDTVAAREGLFLPTGERDFSLYLCIPFCPSRCDYCSFISGAGEKMLGLIPAYLEKLTEETKALAVFAAERGLTLRSIYIGGGTPAVLSAEQLSALCASIRENFDLSACAEFTVELGRPDAITKEKLVSVREGGADRVCVNPQTLSDGVLASIGRKHTCARFFEALSAAKSCGFRAINCDLIAGLPGDTEESFAASVERLISEGVENITVHTLCLKQGSRFKSDEAQIVRGLRAAGMVNASAAALRAAGYRPYYIYKQKQAIAALENVGWEKGGTASLYNILMMDDMGTVLGAGCGASSKVVGGKSPLRVYAPKYPYEYLRLPSHADKLAALSAAFAQIGVEKTGKR